MDVQAQDVVVGVDGSPSSDRALVWAVDQAVAERRRLALVHATGMITPAYHDAAVISPRDVQEMLREAGEQVLREARAAVRRRAPDVEVTTEFDVADPRQVLLDRSRTSAVMVVGSRGRGPVRSLLLGSTSVALARHGHCPVVVHRPTSGPGPRRGIVLAVDGQRESQPALDWAWRQADLVHRPLTVLHCYWSVLAATERAEMSVEATSDREQERLEVAEAIAGMREKYPDVEVESRLVRALPEQAVAEAADSCELVVVGSHQVTRGQRLMFGSVSVAILEHADCPVAVVPLSH